MRGIAAGVLDQSQGMAPASRRPSSQSSSLPNPPLSARKGNVPARPHMTLSPSLESQPSGASMASAPSGHLATRAPSFSSTGSGGSDNIKVAVRLRPFRYEPLQLQTAYGIGVCCHQAGRVAAWQAFRAVPLPNRPELAAPPRAGSQSLGADIEGRLISFEPCTCVQ